MHSIMNTVDKRLIDLLQAEFPLSSRPFQELGQALGLDEEGVIERVKRLKHSGVLRRIGAVFSPEKLGMVSTLVALKIPDQSHLDRVAEEINKYTEVTHNYQRAHPFNLWFTLTAPDETRLRKIISEIRKNQAIEDLLEFPARRTFKIDARFLVSQL